ncbi:MAG TPA: NAD-dependent epimerase/dehydratase family protein [Firmicutes bacterium]|nr:NAD-dependent epimerase/dehydratase family protein [Bacillota bacterium]
MKILITGAGGFIGRNLVEVLEKDKGYTLFKFNSADNPRLLNDYTAGCEFLFHLAAVHRPADEAEFDRVNRQFLAGVLDHLRKQDNGCPILLASSIQAVDDSPYGRSKRAAEKLVREHAEKSGSRAIIYRLTNTFGRYARPNSHSVVATFCYNIARDLPIVISDPDREMHLYYIDDVIESFLLHLHGSVEPDPDGFYRLPEVLEYRVTLGELAEMLYSFRERIRSGEEFTPRDEFAAKLYQTFRSYF